MADSLIVVRFVSQAGRNRIEIDPKSTVEDLKEQIAEKIGVRPSTIKFYQDMGYKKAFNWSDTTSLKKAGIVNGTQIFIPNKDAKFQDLPGKSGKDENKDEEEKIVTTGPKKLSSTEPVESSKGDGKNKKENGLTPECNHGPKGKCLHWLGVDKKNFEKVGYAWNHPPNEKCTNCKDEKLTQDVKHIPFEHYLNELRAKWKKKHRPDQRCQDCIPLQDISYKMRTDCKSHKPYPQGMCNKCIPQSVILNRQKYRHWDYISILNYSELQAFVDYWQSLHCMEQRVAWLYGYYSEDPSYPDGVRVNIEAIYDPPQIGEMNGFQILNDEEEGYVDIIAECLSLEKVGWIYTSLNYESFLTPKEIREIAKMQDRFSIMHPEGVKVSKFVTIVVKPKGDTGESGIDWYMVSDLCQALERDNIFGNSEENKMMVVREPEENEMVPAIIKEGKTVKEFDPEYFIVSLSNGQPKDEIQDYKILKNYDFLAQNRRMKPNKTDFKKYISAHKGDKSVNKFAWFQFLLYLAKQFDIDTVCAIATKIADNEALEDYLIELVEGSV